MPRFVWQAYAGGRKRTGHVWADSPEQAILALEARGHCILRLYERITIREALTRILPVPDRDRQSVFRALAAGVQAGARPDRTQLKTCCGTGAAAYWAARLCDYVQAGMPLSGAMEAVPQLFRSPVPETIAAAEKTSTVPAVMDRLDTALAREAQQKALVVKSVAYPVTTLALAVPLILVASMVVLPEVASVFGQAGVKLPGPTMALVRLGLWTKRSWGLVIVVFTVLMLAVCCLARRGRGMAPHIPVLGRALVEAGWAGFCLTLADCVEAKMPPSEALSVAAGAVVWDQVRRPALDASAAVRLGVPLALCLDRFHPAVKRELSLQRDDMARRLVEVARSLESTSAAQIETLVSALQPVLTTLVAVMIGSASILICLPALSTMEVP